jgi:hypothetical protein
MSVQQAIARLKSAKIDIDKAPIAELIDELVEYADELDADDPFAKADEMIWKVLDHLN